VPTPIGNLGDITFRAVEVLKMVDTILAEDTRTTGILLKHYAIDTKMQSYHAHNEHRVTSRIIERLQQGETMALVTDAGTPGISDPGFLLVREVLAKGLRVECLPGPTALIPALVLSGFASEKFVFEGFLPPKKGRNKRFQAIAEEIRTTILYESPHRLMKTFDQLEEWIGDHRLISVSRELTKVHEETVRGNVRKLKAYFSEHPLKGEIVVVIEGKGKGDPDKDQAANK
jgi:16S rRNA (cytidine1402-2'-O)-methyltransferase